MSRCFPFPPPGYEKKARTDDVDLLKKEKHREKKHKKEKKDKEKRERKDKEKRESKDKEKRESKGKSDKEGRDGKHKEKKDKKEKHRDKKKDKEKDKDKDKDKSKINAADGKGFPAQAPGVNAGKLHQNEIKQNDKSKINASDGKGFPAQAPGALFEDRLTKLAGINGEKARENNHLVEENKDSKFLMELDRRIRDNDGGAGNQLVQKFTIADRRKDEGAVRLIAKSSGTGFWSVGKEKFQDKGVDAKKIDGSGIQAEARAIGNATVQNHAGNCHPKVDEKLRPLEKSFDISLERTIEGTERVKEKEGDKRGTKRKEKDREKKGHRKDKDRDKEKKKEEKAKKKSEHRNSEQNKLKESNKAGPIGSNSSTQVSGHIHENSIIGENLEQNKLKESNKAGPIGSNSSTQVSRHIHENSIIGENLKKRKEIESNGSLHANDSRPNKLPRPSSSHPFTENGRMLEPCQYASDGPRAAANFKVENKERKINGFIEAPPSAVSLNKTPTAPVPPFPVTEVSAIFLNKTPSAPVPALPVTEVPTKPPHPDTKYLSQVYSVPKADEWSDLNDQEWLFGSNHSQEREPMVKSSEVGDTPQVWAEALHIESADVFALPYVIPY